MRVLGLAAAAAIAAASVATPAAAQPPANGDLQRLVNDLGVQLDLRYRANLPEYQRRYDQLGQTVAAWNASAKTGADRAQITSWLRDAIHSAMPGSAVAWPAVPRFGLAPDTGGGSTPAAETAHASGAGQVDVVRNKPVVPDQVVTKEPLPEPAAQEAAQTEPQSARTSVDEPPAASLPVAGPAATQPPASAPSEEEAGDAKSPTATGAAQAVAKDVAVQPVALPASPLPAADKSAQPAGVTTPWLDHPAAGELPPGLMLGNPFQDDPLPAAQLPPTAPLPTAEPLPPAAPLPVLTPLPGAP